MANSVTTGSIVVGLVNGLENGVYPSGTFSIDKPQLLYCMYDPNNYVTCVNGSDIAWAAATGSFFIANSNAGGSSWRALKST
jgi:hypothetical protein